MYNKKINEANNRCSKIRDLFFFKWTHLLNKIVWKNVY